MSTFQWIAVAAVIVISSARLSRVGVFDGFPPVKWVRDKVFDWTDKTDRRRGWQAITWCAYCFSFWPTLVVILSGYYSNWHPAWWIVNGSLAASYLAAIFVILDREPFDDDDEDDN
jgi:hypothetical protein